MTSFASVRVNKQANVYFDGRCVSHTVIFEDGVKKSVGVILPATLTFNTGAPEIMETVAGRCLYRLAGAADWTACGEGESFSIPGNSSFEIQVAQGETYHYVCHFG